MAAISTTDNDISRNAMVWSLHCISLVACFAQTLNNVQAA